MGFPEIEPPKDTDIVNSISIGQHDLFFIFNDTWYYSTGHKFRDVTGCHLGMLLQPAMTAQFYAGSKPFGEIFSIFKELRELEVESFWVFHVDEPFDPELEKKFNSSCFSLESHLECEEESFRCKQEALFKYFGINERRPFTEEELSKYKEILENKYEEIAKKLR